MGVCSSKRKNEKETTGDSTHLTVVFLRVFNLQYIEKEWFLLIFRHFLFVLWLLATGDVTTGCNCLTTTAQASKITKRMSFIFI